MRKHGGQQRVAWATRWLGAVLFCGVLFCAMHATAQSSSKPTVSNTPAPIPYPDSNTNQPSGYGFPSVDPNFSHRQMNARRDEAFRRMQENAARLVFLTHELQQSIRSHSADATDARRLDEIAKLSRAVRDQMRQ